MPLAFGNGQDRLNPEDREAIMIVFPKKNGGLNFQNASRDNAMGGTGLRTRSTESKSWGKRFRGFFLLICSIFFLQEKALGSADPIALKEQKLSVEGKVQIAIVPQGYELEALTADLEKPRLITFDEEGEMFIGSRRGFVYRLQPPYLRPEVVIKLDGYPHSVAFRKGEILIARTNGLYRAPYLAGQKRIDPGKVSLLARLPSGGGHSSRTVRVGPDGRVYVSLGFSGNCSNQYLDKSYPFEEQRGGIFVLDETGDAASLKPFASGLRNPVGFDWRAETGELYADNNGPDHLGFDLPPEYFSRVSEGSFHGMPWFYYDGKKMRRDDCIDVSPPLPIDEAVAPVAVFPARNAPMAMAFVPAGAMEAALEGDAVVALHGSWATKPWGGYIGWPSSRRHPKIVAVRFEKGRPIRVDDLIAGFQLPDGSRWARPVGIAFGPDGDLYFTSDEGVEALFRLRKRDR